jgi:hypothetical protein
MWHTNPISVLLSAYYSEYPAKHLLINPQKNIERYSLLLHLGKAAAHNSRLSSEKIEPAKAQRVPHPPYSPDQA